MRRAAVALLCGGCTFGPGEPWVDVRGGALDARWDPGARGIGGRDALNDLAAVWRLDALTAGVEGIDLEELVTSGGGGGVFDPANPPDGYSLCHGGHCHADDGALVSYSEIQAALGGGSSSFQVLVGWAPEAELSLVGGATLALDRPGEALPETTVARVAVHLHEVVAEGELDGAPFEAELEALELAADLGFAVGADAPEAVRLALDWTVDGTLLDGVDPASPTLEDDLAAAFAAALATQPLTAALVEAR